MGIELAGEEFRKEKLNRFADQEKIIRAFKMLKDANIKEPAIILLDYQIKMNNQF